MSIVFESEGGEREGSQNNPTKYEIEKVTPSHSTLLKRACSMIPSTLRVFNY